MTEKDFLNYLEEKGFSYAPHWNGFFRDDDLSGGPVGWIIYQDESVSLVQRPQDGSFRQHVICYADLKDLSVEDGKLSGLSKTGKKIML
jgi:hypothetical protein